MQKNRCQSFIQYTLSSCTKEIASYLNDLIDMTKQIFGPVFAPPKNPKNLLATFTSYFPRNQNKLITFLEKNAGLNCEGLA